MKKSAWGHQIQSLLNQWAPAGRVPFFLLCLLLSVCLSAGSGRAAVPIFNGPAGAAAGTIFKVFSAAENKSTALNSGRLLFGGEDSRPLPDRVVLPVKALRQTDPLWAEAALGSATVGSEGCALTCLAMYDTVYGHTETTPLSLRDELGRDAYPLEWEAYASLRGKELCQKDDTVLRPNRLTSKAYVEHTILRHLAAKRPVIIGLYTRATGGTHFVLAHSYEFVEGDYEIRLYDPAEGTDYRFFSDIEPERGFCRLVAFK